MMNMAKLRELALRYAAARTGQQIPPPNRAIPVLPPGLPQRPQPTMRFNPDVLLDTSQVEDRRTVIHPGGRAGLGGDRPADMYALTQQFEAARTARNKRSTGVGVNKHGKSSRRY